MADMDEIVKTMEFFSAFSMAIQMAFETLFSLPFVESYFKKAKERAYLKRVLILTFCLVLCSMLYVITGPDDGALFLARTFGKRVPYLDVFFTAFILAGGSNAIHHTLQRMSGRTAQKLMESKGGS